MGESLFFCSQKKYPKKAVATPGAPVKGTGVPIDAWRVTCYARTHPRKACGFRQAGTENPCYPSCLNGLANAKINQKKKTKKKNTNNNWFWICGPAQGTLQAMANKNAGNKKTLSRPTKEHRFWPWPSVHFSKPFSRYRYHGPSVPACLSVLCEFWRSMITVLAKWVPLFFRGVACVAAFSGYSFGL